MYIRILAVVESESKLNGKVTKMLKLLSSCMALYVDLISFCLLFLLFLLPLHPPQLGLLVLLSICKTEKYFHSISEC